MRYNNYILVMFLGLVLFYNNCSSPNSPDNNDQFSTFGNGTPYGGKPSNDFIPAGNQICSSSFEEKIRIEGSGSNEKVFLEIPCENRDVQLDKTKYVKNTDGDRILYNNFGYAHLDTERAQAKEHYMLACRTTEQNFGPELLVYGPAPVYTLELLSLDSELLVYTAQLSFRYQSSGTTHSFEGEFDTLTISPMESGFDFVGSWQNPQRDGHVTQYDRMICDNLTGIPIDEW